VVSRPLDEASLVVRAKHGDAAAYEELVHRHQAIAFRVAFVAAGDRGDAEEAVQDGFVKAFRALGRFRDGAPFRPWLLQIVANEARNRRTAANRHPTVDLAAITDRPAPNGDQSPEQAAIAADQRARLVEALNQLREEDRAIIAYRYLLDLTEAEMASALDCPRGTVKSRLSRALDRLRAQLVAETDRAERGRTSDV
jgi:RNA polymerase sigma-70 factor (ECF subfamily)